MQETLDGAAAYKLRARALITANSVAKSLADTTIRNYRRQSWTVASMR